MGKKRESRVNHHYLLPHGELSSDSPFLMPSQPAKTRKQFRRSESAVTALGSTQNIVDALLVDKPFGRLQQIHSRSDDSMIQPNFSSMAPSSQCDEIAEAMSLYGIGDLWPRLAKNVQLQNEILWPFWRRSARWRVGKSLRQFARKPLFIAFFSRERPVSQG
jgi:hypothetical protein